jgi:4-amino-4-deoxy-L-arabinose transferase-like glycosyltransferase
LLLVIAFFSFYYGLGAYPLFDNNEGLYAEIPREMVLSGDYVLPHLNGVPYIEKPPLLYWLIALSYRWFGINEFAARLVPATAALLTGLTLMWFLWRLNARPVCLLAGAVWATSFGVVALARTVLFDMVLTFFLTVALVCCCIWAMENGRTYLRVAYAALGLAVLTKGLVALALCGITVAAFCVVSETAWPLFSFARMRAAVRKLAGFPDPAGILLFLAIVVPWHVLVARRDRNFVWFYFVNEHLLRFINMRKPHDYHSGSLRHYLPWIIGYLFPWSVLLPFWLLKRCRRRNTPAEEFPHRAPRRFLWCWFLAFLVFFSVAGVRSSYYMIAGMPPLAALLAFWLGERVSSAHRWLVPATVTATVVIVVLGGMFMKWLPVPGFAPLAESVDRGVKFALAAVGIPGAVLSWIMDRRRTLVSCITLTLVWGIGAVGALEMVRRNANAYSSKDIIDAIRSRQPHPEIFLYSDFESWSALTFYADRPLPIVNSTSRDLEYGLKTLEGRKLALSLFDLQRLPAECEQFLIINREDFGQLRDKGVLLTFRPWKAFGRTLIRVRPAETRPR